MAQKCCVCDIKIGSFTTCNTWIKDRDDLVICQDCTEKYQLALRKDIKLESQTLTRMQLDALEFFAARLLDSNMDEQVKAELRKLPTPKDLLERQEKEAKLDAERNARMQSAKWGFLLSTTPSLEGYRIIAYKNIVSVDMPIVGKASANDVSSVKEEALQGLAMKAAEAEGNAVVGVTFMPYLSCDNSLVISITGTAVVAEKLM